MSETQDPKKKYLEALEKKKTKNIPLSRTSGRKSKVQGGQSNVGTPKIFRRKSGSS